MKTSDTIVREVVMNYFRIVDARNFDELGKVFHPQIIYKRPNYKTIKGLDELIYFYKNTRILSEGYHKVFKLIVEDNFCACEGKFVGKDKSGHKVNERFFDRFEFRNGLVKNRMTYFYRPAV